MDIAAPISELQTLTAPTRKLFARAGVQSVRDLLLHLPLRYEDHSRITAISAAQHAEFVQLYATVNAVKFVGSRGKMLSIIVSDDNGDSCQLKYFNFYPSLIQQFTIGKRGLFYGKASIDIYGCQLHHPQIRWLKDMEVPVLTQNLSAIYATVKGLSQPQWREIIAIALDKIDAAARDNLQIDELQNLGFCSFNNALRNLHQPNNREIEAQLLQAQHPARQRLIFEELCANRLFALRLRHERQQEQAIVLQNKNLENFIQQLPFTLTAAQRRVLDEIRGDLARDVPMLRLLQGDVGSGKTIIALLTCLMAQQNGKQAVLLAPTELLAEQHAANFRNLLAAVDVNIVLLVSKLATAQKKQIIQDIATGKAAIIIGTHAVFQKSVHYHDLALIIIDEQHRFGVAQRLQLSAKSKDNISLHQLVMSATPIPRTLAMSCYGEMDSSIIDELPPHRMAVSTSIINNCKRAQLIARVREKCLSGAQVYWVCALIEQSSTLDCENAIAVAKTLQQQLSECVVAVIHGKMDSVQRNEIMQQFASGNISLLVATTVIEVGVDVKNATIIVIENAERFGAAQLHQLRGRVGRGNASAHCILLYQQPLSAIAQQRLAIIRDNNDGFAIAQLDLQMRGGGELLGVRQTGQAFFYIADLNRDDKLLATINKYCQLWHDEKPQWAQQLQRRWLDDRKGYLRA